MKERIVAIFFKKLEEIVVLKSQAIARKINQLLRTIRSCGSSKIGSLHTLPHKIWDERLISIFDAFNWPSHSLDLTVPDYFLWGYLKERVYENKSQQRVYIRNEIGALQPEILRNVIEDKDRLSKEPIFMSFGGRNFRQLL